MFPLAHHHLQTNEEHRPSATAVSRPPEEQRLLRIGIEPSVVGGAAVSLHDADGVDQRDGCLQLRTTLRREKNNSVSAPLRPRVSTKFGSCHGTGRGGRGDEPGRTPRKRRCRMKGRRRRGSRRWMRRRGGRRGPCRRCGRRRRRGKGCVTTGRGHVGFRGGTTPRPTRGRPSMLGAPAPPPSPWPPALFASGSEGRTGE